MPALMYHGAAGKVQRAIGRQQTTTPDIMRHGHVAEAEPQHGERSARPRAHALGEQAHNQRHGDGRKRGLEGDKHVFGDGGQRAKLSRPRL